TIHDGSATSDLTPAAWLAFAHHGPAAGLQPPAALPAGRGHFLSRCLRGAPPGGTGARDGPAGTPPGSSAPAIGGPPAGGGHGPPGRACAGGSRGASRLGCRGPPRRRFNPIAIRRRGDPATVDLCLVQRTRPVALSTGGGRGCGETPHAAAVHPKRW